MSSIDRFLPFIARACLVLLFPFSALDKIFDYGNAVAQADASGMPVPGWLLLLLGGCLEVFGSLGILLNIYARQFALLFCFYCVVSAVLFHNFWIYPFGSADWMAHFWEFLKTSAWSAASCLSPPAPRWNRSHGRSRWRRVRASKVEGSGRGRVDDAGVLLLSRIEFAFVATSHHLRSARAVELACAASSAFAFSGAASWLSVRIRPSGTSAPVRYAAFVATALFAP